MVSAGGPTGLDLLNGGLIGALVFLVLVIVLGAMVASIILRGR
jgi:hypothetical protein